MTLLVLKILGILMGLSALSFILYRLHKSFERRCSCGSIFVRRIKKRRPNPDIYPADSIPVHPGHQQTFVFGDCSSCGEFSQVKSENKYFTRWEIWWRETFHPDETNGVQECLIRAGIEQPPSKEEPPSSIRKPPVPVQHLNVSLSPSIRRAREHQSREHKQSRIATPELPVNVLPQ